MLSSPKYQHFYCLFPKTFLLLGREYHLQKLEVATITVVLRRWCQASLAVPHLYAHHCKPFPIFSGNRYFQACFVFDCTRHIFICMIVQNNLDMYILQCGFHESIFSEVRVVFLTNERVDFRRKNRPRVDFAPLRYPCFGGGCQYEKGCTCYFTSYLRKSTRVDFRVQHAGASKMIDCKIDSYVQLYDTMMQYVHI